MYFLLSGEGPTDIGLCPDNADTCEGDRHLPGPLAIIISQIVEQRFHFSFMETQFYGFVSKNELVKKASTLKCMKKRPMLPGKKSQKETGYFYRNARALALCAMDKESEFNDQVIAVLFRDSDGTASAGRGHWKDKWNSIVRGFSDEGFEGGVPMVPKPKSEAWIICSIKEIPYEDCERLEKRSGNDNSPKSLKDELTIILGELPSRKKLCEMVKDGTIDPNKIDMPSFQLFKRTLLDKL